MDPKPIACVTGGSGFVGLSLAAELTRRGYAPVLIDWVPPPPAALAATGLAPNALPFIRADIRDEPALRRAFQGASIVFHVASYGMSGTAQLDRPLVEAINIGGTRAVLGAAVAAGVERLVYTSTYNVVFGGQSIDLGDESLPFWPLDQHADAYSTSKAVSEAAVLAANGTPLPVPRRRPRRGDASSRRRLRTCALRPAAIWGPGEQRHTPRVIKYAGKGLFFFAFGDKRAKVDFVHIANLVQAHILAAEALARPRGGPAAGQAYFINDGEERALNNFEFFGRLVRGLGHAGPRLWVPLWAIYAFAFVSEHMYAVAVALGAPFLAQPLLTRAEVLKAGIQHTFRIDKAREDLRYDPKGYDLQDVIEGYIRKGHHVRARRHSGGGGGGLGKSGWCGRGAVMWVVRLLLFIVFLGGPVVLVAGWVGRGTLAACSGEPAGLN